MAQAALDGFDYIPCQTEAGPAIHADAKKRCGIAGHFMELWRYASEMIATLEAKADKSTLLEKAIGVLRDSEAASELLVGGEAA